LARRRSGRLLVVSTLAFLAIGCGADGDLTGPAADACGPGPYFSALPIALSDIERIVVFGGLGAPGHTLPTAHAGMYLLNEGAAVSSPGDLQITQLRRTRYLVSPNRQGREDYGVLFQVCREVSGWFGHLTTLAASVAPEATWSDCQQYSTATETVESCSASLRNVLVRPGQPLGTGGMSRALGLMGFDFGMEDSRVDNFYIARQRHPPQTFHAICPWDQFGPALRDQLYTKLGDPGRPGLVPAGEPRCGTMTVDVAGTAKGVWVLQGSNPQPGNETAYLTLANYPYRPEDHLALSLGPNALGARVAVVGRQASGRVNRPFESVTDSQIYCYGPDAASPTVSWLLALTGPSQLDIKRTDHALGASPCLASTATWNMSGAVRLTR